MYVLDRQHIRDSISRHMSFIQEQTITIIADSLSHIGFKVSHIEITPVAKIMSTTDLYSEKSTQEDIEIFWHIKLHAKSTNPFLARNWDMIAKTNSSSGPLNSLLENNESQSIIHSLIYSICQTIVKDFDAFLHSYLAQIHYSLNKEMYGELYQLPFELIHAIGKHIERLTGSIKKMKAANVSGILQESFRHAEWGLSKQHIKMGYESFLLAIKSILDSSKEPYLLDYGLLLEKFHEGFAKSLLELKVGQEVPLFQQYIQIYKTFPCHTSIELLEDLEGYAFFSKIFYKEKGSNTTKFVNTYSNAAWIYVAKEQGNIYKRTTANTTMSKRIRLAHSMVKQG